MGSDLNIFVWKWSKIAKQKKYFLWLNLPYKRLKGVSLTLAYFKTFLSFYILDDFFRFSKNLGFWVFLVHPTVVLVLLSASVERCFVSRMRDLKKKNYETEEVNRIPEVI